MECGLNAEEVRPMRATKTMHIDAKPERVMSFFLDWTATPPGMTMEVVHESPDVVGNSYEWTFKMLGMPRKGVTVYTDYVPAERLAFRNFGVLEGTSTWTVEPEDGGSKVTVQVESRLAVPLIGRFLDPILRREWEKNVAWGKRDMEKQLKVKKTTA
jgi:uncharacterized protein YndB with AHSA1/START domain